MAEEITPPHATGIRNVYLILYFIGAVLSGAGGNYLWLNRVGPEVVGADRYTGTQAASLTTRVDRNEQDIVTMREIVSGHVTEHPDLENRYDLRIAVLESQISSILLNQQRMMDKLDELGK